MPNYDFRCLDCHKRFEIFLTYQQYGKETVRCKFCGSENIQRRIGRVRVLRSDEKRLVGFDGPGDLESLENNPRELGRMFRKMSSELGEDAGPEFNEVVSRLESGQSPEEIEKSLPELGRDGEGSGDFAGRDPDDF